MALVGAEGQNCYFFPSIQAAQDCKAFATSPSREDKRIPAEDVSIRTFRANVDLYAVLFPEEFTATVHHFWLNSGVGISSRLAEDTLKNFDTLHEIATGEPSRPKGVEGVAHLQLRERIAALLNRAPIDPHRSVRASQGDVYLYQTGMAAIYWVHRYLLNQYASSSVLFGFAFHSTIHVLEDFGPGVEFLGLASQEELDVLEQHLATQSTQGKKVQAIWAEFPSNPLLTSPDLGRLRELADKYEALLVIDDTIGSFCSVDVLGAADIIVSSLTKSFSGYADVMAASAILSPLSRRYATLKKLFDEQYHNDFFIGDAEALEHNSRNYLERSAILNNNAARLVEFLHQRALDPTSTVKKVFYPTVNESSAANYRAFMRPPTDDFTPGHGCLFSVEFDSLDATVAFYDNLNVHMGPHLGAHLTIAIGYCMGVYGNELEWAGKFNVRPTQIRVSVGLEDTEMLLEVFRAAVQAADSRVDVKN